MEVYLEEIVVEVIEVLTCSTVHIIPPVTCEILLMKHCAIGTHKTILYQSKEVRSTGQTNVKDLREQNGHHISTVKNKVNDIYRVTQKKVCSVWWDINSQCLEGYISIN